MSRDPANRQFQLSVMFLLTLNAAAVLLPVVYFGAQGWALTWILALASICWWMKAGVVAAAFIVCGLAVLCVIPVLSLPRGQSPGMACRNNMRNIALALTNYESVHGHYPPAFIADESGKPMHSWRVLILPYLEEQELYDRYRFDEPWDGPNNRKLHDLMPSVYRCPSEDGTTTGYLAIVGENTVLRPHKGRPESEITDGIIQTILVVEHQMARTHWMSPYDIDLASHSKNSATPPPLSSNHYSSIANVAFCDAHVISLAPTTNKFTFYAAATVDGGEVFSEDEF